MARNGAGAYSLPAGNPVVTGTVISSSTMNTTLSDIATALTASIANDGQTVPVANIPMGGFKLTGLGDATVANDAIRYNGALGTPSSGTVTNLTGTASININGTVGATTPAAGSFTTATLAAGTAAAPSLTTTGDTNTGVWFPAADTMAVSTGGSERMRIDPSGNIQTTVAPSSGTGHILHGQSVSYSSAFGEQPLMQISQQRGTNGNPLALYTWGNDSVGAEITLAKSRGTTVGTQTIVQVGDQLGVIQFCGSDGVNMHQSAANIRAVVAATPGASADMPGSLVFATTSDGAGSPTDRLSINQNGDVIAISPTGSLGYGTGAGGTVTQSTSRTTGVTLNKPTGGITLFTAAGSATPTTFTVTNSLVATTDTVVLSVKSGTNVYLTAVTAVAAGSFNVTFWTTGGTASDAPVINYSVIKGATS